ncbi:MAG TPA: hypothetical protein VFU22_23010 [Roseiflexaceae bacterium]|nr:hypothetical protein [Roseiflexaceae bacterium]
MERANLDWLLRRATAYERWRAPLDTRLRQAIVMSGAGSALVLLTLWALPLISQLEPSPFLLFLRPQFGAILGLLSRARLPLLVLNLVCAMNCVALTIATRGLRAGRGLWHWVGFCQAAIGAINGLILALALAIVLLNLALWVICAAVALGLLLGFLGRPQ